MSKCSKTLPGSSAGHAGSSTTAGMLAADQNQRLQPELRVSAGRGQRPTLRSPVGCQRGAAGRRAPIHGTAGDQGIQRQGRQRAHVPAGVGGRCPEPPEAQKTGGCASATVRHYRCLFLRVPRVSRRDLDAPRQRCRPRRNALPPPWPDHRHSERMPCSARWRSSPAAAAASGWRYPGNWVRPRSRLPRRSARADTARSGRAAGGARDTLGWCLTPPAWRMARDSPPPGPAPCRAPRLPRGHHRAPAAGPGRGRGGPCILGRVSHGHAGGQTPAAAVRRRRHCS
jgi:hypothetical protein